MPPVRCRRTHLPRHDPLSPVRKKKKVTIVDALMSGGRGEGRKEVQFADRVVQAGDRQVKTTSKAQKTTSRAQSAAQQHSANQGAKKVEIITVSSDDENAANSDSETVSGNETPPPINSLGSRRRSISDYQNGYHHGFRTGKDKTSCPGNCNGNHSQYEHVDDSSDNEGSSEDDDGSGDDEGEDVSDSDSDDGVYEFNDEDCSDRYGDNYNPNSNYNNNTTNNQHHVTVDIHANSASYSTRPEPCPIRGLKLATPAINCDLPYTTQLSPAAGKIYEDLVDSLAEGVIPHAIKNRIPTLEAQSIPESAYDKTDLTPEKIEQFWGDIQEVLKKARDGSVHQHDKSYWEDDVVWHVLRYSSYYSMLGVRGDQMVREDLLPDTSEMLELKGRESRLFRTSFAMSYYRSTKRVIKLYDALATNPNANLLNQSTDNAGDERVALFTGIEVKSESGNKEEALAQLAVWMAAGAENLLHLRRASGQVPYMHDDLLPIFGWTVIGHDWHTYIAFGRGTGTNETLHILGPWRSLAADTRDVYGVCKLFKLLSEVMNYATTTYWPWLKGNILDPLCP